MLKESNKVDSFSTPNKDEWVRVMKDLFKYTHHMLLLYKKDNISEFHIAARLFFTKIKQHTLENKGFVDGNKRSAVLAIIIHYIAWRFIIEGKDDDNIRLSATADELYEKAREIAAMPSVDIDDEHVLNDLTCWFRSKSNETIFEKLFHW